MHNFIFKKVSSKEEMEKSYAIRTKVFCQEQKISKEIEFDNLDHLCSHFLIFDDKKAIATARVRKKEKKILKIERVAVSLEFRRLKVGSVLIKKIIKHYINLDHKKSIILHSQIAVADFYKSLNFISYGNDFFEDGIPHIAMKYVIKS
jgi:predicted GNAT family N-acyltransferase